MRLFYNRSVAIVLFAALWLPVGLLVHYLFCDRDRASGYFILGTYALMGFNPYGLGLSPS
jgi:hypothetical protein